MAQGAVSLGGQTHDQVDGTRGYFNRKCLEELERTICELPVVVRSADGEIALDRDAYDQVDGATQRDPDQ